MTYGGWEGPSPWDRAKWLQMKLHWAIKDWSWGIENGEEHNFLRPLGRLLRCWKKMIEFLDLAWENNEWNLCQKYGWETEEELDPLHTLLLKHVQEGHANVLTLHALSRMGKIYGTTVIWNRRGWTWGLKEAFEKM